MKKMDRLIALRLPKADAEAIKQIARSENIRPSELYRRAIQEFLAVERMTKSFENLLD